MNPSPGTSSATNEELLRRVIEAQVRGGHRTWSFILDWSDMSWNTRQDHIDGWVAPFLTSDLRQHTLLILLDTEGCKAAYGSDPSRYDIEGVTLLLWEAAAMKIAEGWHSGDGNNVRAALETAVSLLPE